jgi:hypothetical protein
LARGNPCGEAFGATLAGIDPVALDLAAGLIDALAGSGILPC